MVLVQSLIPLLELDLVNLTQLLSLVQTVCTVVQSPGEMSDRCFPETGPGKSGMRCATSSRPLQKSAPEK